MNKVQFYPSDELYEIIKKKADEMDISINALVCNSLSDVFCKAQKSKSKSEVELAGIIFAEIKEFVRDKDIDYEFDLMSASNTYADLESICEGNTNSIKAKIGNNFAKKVGKDERFKNIEVAKNRNGNTKKNQNNAIIYKVVSLNK